MFTFLLTLFPFTILFPLEFLSRFLRGFFESLQYILQSESALLSNSSLSDSLFFIEVLAILLLAILELFRPIPIHFSKWGANREAAKFLEQLGQTHSCCFFTGTWPKMSSPFLSIMAANNQSNIAIRYRASQLGFHHLLTIFVVSDQTKSQLFNVWKKTNQLEIKQYKRWVIGWLTHRWATRPQTEIGWIWPLCAPRSRCRSALRLWYRPIGCNWRTDEPKQTLRYSIEIIESNLHSSYYHFWWIVSKWSMNSASKQWLENDRTQSASIRHNNTIARQSRLESGHVVCVLAKSPMFQLLSYCLIVNIDHISLPAVNVSAVSQYDSVYLYLWSIESYSQQMSPKTTKSRLVWLTPTLQVKVSLTNKQRPVSDVSDVSIVCDH